MKFERFLSLTGIEVELLIENRMYVDGEFVTNDETVATTDPATGTHLADVPVATEDQINQAVAAAARASQEWNSYSPVEKGKRLETFADALSEASDDLANLDVADTGSTIKRMQYDPEKGAELIRYFAGLITELKGDTLPTEGQTFDFTRREPYGVVAAISPFNHPAMFVGKKLAPALAAGNGIVMKPSEVTPLSALYVGHLVEETAIFPDGLVNFITGAGGVGQMLVEHPNVDLINMNGSVEVGKRVMESAATNVTDVILELGGKNPTIVFPDANVEKAATGAAKGMSLPWQGQSCSSGSRLLVHESIRDDVVSRVVDRFEAVRPDDPFKESADMGSIVSRQQYEKVLRYIEQTKEESAELLTGGEAIQPFETGYFIEPTVFEVAPELTIANEEVFGPVLSVITWSDYEEMIEIANGVDYGLTASVWTDSLQDAHRAIEDLEAGYVWVNQHGGHFTGAPFGGYKESGIGKKDSLEGLIGHTRLKNVNVNFEGGTHDWHSLG
ncbi:aldehyde dehydrogenase family protein [Halorarum salinum]|uniref:Aldehyde dehydrogenase family protein n=1 Tax=Halorarum salinum TaxID=2743089 RepID=A0A7D5QDZ2_9EURY|nr:aldehyde dehydrogenase family protein [Halobaculum salinum]QLG60322.1 aldehyde dehydrogenase family protein [Halobaculum salinum]